MTGELIATAIEDSGLRKDFVAGCIGVHPSQLSKWISGDRVPSKHQARLLAATLHKRLEDLFPPATFPDLYDQVPA